MPGGILIGRRFNPTRFGVFGRVHHKPAFDLLDNPLASGGGQDVPTAANAMLELDYRAAVAGNKAALKRSLKQLKLHETAKMRAINRHPQEHFEYENPEFERVDEAARLLGIVVDRQYTYTDHKIDFITMTHHRDVWKTVERTAPGLPGWLLKAARLRRGCPPGAYALVQTWMKEGGFAQPRYEEDDLAYWPVSDQSEYDND